MKKTILLTGATDGIGLEAAKLFVQAGHTLLIHGRSLEKLASVQQLLSEYSSESVIEVFNADLSSLSEVAQLASKISEKYAKIDVLINNAGVLKTANPINDQGLDNRFVVNTIAPYLLTIGLLGLLGSTARVINLSSAAQASVDLSALEGERVLDDMQAYAQSKLALTMWTKQLAKTVGMPVMIALNPSSLLASKMVKEHFGVAGADLSIGASVIVRAALSDEFSQATGLYYDNDIQQFSDPHRDALNTFKCQQLVEAVEKILKNTDF